MIIRSPPMKDQKRKLRKGDENHVGKMHTRPRA